MGTARYIETVNNQVAIYTTAFSLVSQASTRVLGNTTDSYLGDPQIVWDTTTKKFYYAMFDELSDGTYRLDIGYSRGPKRHQLLPAHWRELLRSGRSVLGGGMAEKARRGTRAQLPSGAGNRNEDRDAVHAGPRTANRPAKDGVRPFVCPIRGLCPDGDTGHCHCGRPLIR
jgi:hypothetical protein